MKLVIISILFIGLSAFGDDTLVNVPAVNQNEIKITTPEVSNANPKWQFTIGESRISVSGVKQNDDGSFSSTSVKSTGVTIGAIYNIIDLVGIGISYTNFKSDGDTNSNTQMGTGYVNVTPVRYSFGVVDMAASLQFGDLAYNFQDIGDSKYSQTNFFYGASLGARWNKKIGVMLDSKIAKDFQSIYGLSLVGSY